MNCLKPFWLKDFGFYVPCGRCSACKKRRTLAWANRLNMERMYWKDASFVTLTYEDVFLPPTLQPEDMQKYLKRLRRDLGDRHIKFFGCGEYSPRGRPHYHLIIYGLSPVKDRAVIQENWPYADWNALEQTERGRRSIGTVTYGSCYYVAGYIQKKLIGKKALEDYKANGIEPPFIRMSKGLGLSFLNDNAEVLKDTLSVGFNGYTTPLPKYFRDKLGITPEQMKWRHFYQVADKLKLVVQRHPWLNNASEETLMRVLALEEKSAFNKDYQDSVYQAELDANAKDVLYSRGEEL